MSIALAANPTRVVDEAAAAPAHGNVVRDLVAVFVAPSRLFEELPRQNRFAAALTLLLLVHGLYGWAVVSTGVGDYEIDLQTQRAVAQFLIEHEGEEETQQMVSALDAIEKAGTFNKQFSHVVEIVGRPLRLLMGTALLTGVFFVIVALTAGKPSNPTLAGILSFASWVAVPEFALRLLLLSQLQVTRVETSAAAFATGPEIGIAGYILLRRLNPFEIWFWGLVGLGLWRSGQLGGRSALFWTFVVALFVGGLWCIGDVVELGEYTWTPPET